MKLLPAFLAPALLAGCMAIPSPDTIRPAPQGSAVALGQSVLVGKLRVTPLKVVEDSRCPANARCMWEGRLVVKTRVDGNGWCESADLRLGETYGTHGKVIALTSGEPGKTTDRDTRPEDYRFTYEAR